MQGDEERERSMTAANPVILPLSEYEARHVRFKVDGKVATLTLDRPDKKNPLTFDSYAEIVDLFRAAAKDRTIKAIVVTGAGGNFCSGGDVFEIIEPLTKMSTVELLGFTRMTGDVVKAMRGCPHPIIAAVDGVCAGAGAIVAMASDIRIGTVGARVAFLFNRVGLAGCDMGACAILPRIVGQGRAAELLFTGRAMGGEEAERFGFFNQLSTPENVLADAMKLANDLANGPTFANAMTKRMLEMEWAMSVETAVEAEAVAQALCMETQDFSRAFRAFAAKQKPAFEGN
jgi:enoyl-CoA hydratase/carnithine racemase